MATGGGQTFNVTIGANMDVSGVLGAVKQMQGAFNALKMPPALTANMIQDFNKLQESLKKFETLAKQDHFSKADLKTLDKLQKEIDSTFNHLADSFNDLKGQKFYLEADYTAIKEADAEVKRLKDDLQNKFKDLKIDFTSAKGGAASLGLDEIVKGFEQGVSSSKVLTRAMSEVKQSLQIGDLGNAGAQLTQIATKANDLKGAGTGLLNLFNRLGLIDLSKPASDLVKTKEGARLLEQGMAKLLPIFNSDSEAIKTLIQDIAKATQEKERLEQVGQNNVAKMATEGAAAMNDLSIAEKNAANSSMSVAKATSEAAEQIKQLQQSTKYFFSLRNMLNLFKRGVKEAFNTVKELDKAMTETAVVTKFDVSDMWEKLPEYTANANALGATVQDMYESTTLYYQQGLDTQQAMTIATETMKMARIAGMEAKDATDMMTAALRGFNMEINETSAERINDVYSNLAAKTASNTQEIGTAMQRTASIAHSAGMSFEGTAAFLAQAIETTREPAENLGTAMKTIVARFTELKKNPLEIAEVDGEEVSYNKVDAALQSIGVSLKDANGQFRDLDKVFLDISQRWDSLSQTQQRYIATTAAGSRQQSRFIAMMSNYERTMQLMDYANDSAGASTEQFNKTLESLEAKLNKFQNAWKQFLMGIMNDKWTKRIVDAGTGILNVVNKIIDALSLNGKLGLLKSALSTFTAFTALKFAGKGANALIGGLGGMIDPQSSFLGGMRQGMFGNRQAVNAAQAQAIYQPIVNELRALRQLHGQEIAQTNRIATSGPYAEYDQLKSARANIMSMGGQGTINNLTKQLSGLSMSNQNLLISGNAGLFRSATNAIIDQYGVKNRKEVRAGERFLNNQRKSGQITAEQYYKALQDPALLKQAMIKAGVREHNPAYEYINGLDEAISIKAGKMADLAKEKVLKSLQYTAENKYGLGTQEYFNELEKNYKKVETAFQSDKAQAYFRQQALGEQNDENGPITFKNSKWANFLDNVGKVGSGIAQAGIGLQSFGNLLTSSANPAIQMFGTTLTTIGGLISSLGMSISALTVGFTTLASSEAMEAAASWLVTKAKGAEALASAPIAGIATALTAGLLILVAAIAGVALAIKKHNDNIKKAAEEVTQNYKDKSSENQSNIANLRQWKGELAALSKGVDENGYNVSLDTSDYDHYLEIVDAIAKMNPEIVQGYNAQGHAIINNNKALEDTLALEEKREKQILKDYTSPDSLTKLLKARNLQLRRSAGGGYGDKYVETIDFELKPRTNMRQEISKIGSELKRNKDLIDLSKLDIDIDALAAGQESEFKKVLDNYDLFEKLVYESIERAGDSWSDASQKAIDKSFAAFDESSEELDELVQPTYEALSASASQTAGFKEMSNSLKAPFQKALRDLASNGEFKDGKLIGEAAKNMALKFASYNDIYLDAMKEVEVANQQFALDLNEQEYKVNTEDAIKSLDDLKNSLEDTPENHAIRDWLTNEIDHIEKHMSGATKTIEEAWDTIAGKVAVAESALDNFTKSTEKDYYTAADDMQKIFDTVMDEDAYHTVGLGDQTFWTGAESLLGTDNIMDKTKQEVLDMMNAIEPFLKEGPEGAVNFKNKIAEVSDQLDEANKGIKGVHMSSDGWFESIDENVNPDAWKEIANYLGMSEELLTSLINKSRQFVPWDFSDMQAIREAYSTSDTVIHGTQKVDVTTTDENGEEKVVQAEKLFITDAEFRSRMGTDYYNKQKREEKQEQLAAQGIDILPESLSELSANIMKTQMGIEDWTGAIETFGETGAFDKSEIYEAAKTLAQEEQGEKFNEEEFADVFNEKYSNWLENYENPLLDPIQQGVSTLEAIASKYLGTEQESDKDKNSDEKSPSADKSDKSDKSEKSEKPTTSSGPAPYTPEQKDYYSRNNGIFKQWLGELFSNSNVSETPQEDPKIQALEKSTENAKNISDRLDSIFNTSINDKTGYTANTETAPASQTNENADGNASLTEAASQLKAGIESLTTAGESLNTAASNLTSAAAILATSNNENHSNGLPNGAAGPPAPNQQSSASGIVVVDNSAALESFEAIKTSASETKTQVETPMTVSIEVSDRGLRKAADRVKTINEGTGSKNIDVTATTSDPAEVNELKEAVEAYSKLNDHEVDLTADLDGASATSIYTTIDAIDDFHKRKDHEVTLTVNYKTTGTKTDDHKATGAHNHGYVAPPSFGSAAGGYGQVGPKGKGGLTLTGELGYEIAWIPSENRSMILGANGPQMVNLPGDAVVWTHEQSKKILKRKAIPAGSNGDGTPTTATSTGKWDFSGYTKTTTSTDVSKDVKKAASDTSQAASTTEEAAKKLIKVSVWWENMNRRIDATQRKADKNQQAYEKYIKRITATLKNTGTKGKGNAYISNLENLQKLNRKEYKKARKELRALDKGSNYSKVSISYTDDNGKSKSENVSLNKYIKKKYGTYIVDSKALKTVGNKEKRKAIADAANKEIDDRLSKRTKAADAIAKANEELSKFSEELYETFFGWETSLTKIWNLTQQIEQTTAKISRIDAQNDLLGAQLDSGKITSDSATQKDLNLFRQKLFQQNQLLEERQNAIEQGEKEVQKAIGSSDEDKELKTIQNKLKADEAATKKKTNAQNKNKKINKKISNLNKKIKDSNTSKKEKQDAQKEINKLKNKKKVNNKTISKAHKSILSDTERLAYKEAEKQTKFDQKVIKQANKYTKITKNADGTVKVDFDADALEKDRLKGLITDDMAKGIEDYVNGVIESSNALNEQYESLTNEIAGYYTSLNELQDEWVQYEEELIQMTEESNKKELDQLKKLSDSIKKAFDELIDSIKRKLDERRKQEDNKKTEQDISQKQQRLTMLRADTSGGHQVEIAQLEKEIAEAQQNYQRSLEDQLLDRLKEQGDKAAKQRERQIELQEALLTATNNAEQVDALMQELSALDPENPKDKARIDEIKKEMQQLYRDSHQYDKKGIYGQSAIDQDFEKFFTGMTTNQKKQQELTKAIDGLTEALDLVKKALVNITELRTKMGVDVKTAHDEYGFSYKDLKEQGGYTAADFAKAGIDYETAKKAGFSVNDLAKTDFYKAQANDEIQAQQAETRRQQQLEIDRKAQEEEQRRMQEEQAKIKAQNDYDNFLYMRGNKTKTSDPNWGGIGKDGLNAQIKRGEKIGKNEMRVLQDLANTSALGWGTVLKAYINLRGKRAAAEAVKKYFGTNVNNVSVGRKNGWKAAFGKNYPQYKTGGLADYTGPAWLDGTPSKPELVLNSTDTKNFVALKDVLSKAMNSIGSTDNTTYGDIMYEININVDKIEKDYDVDKVVDKVKREIVKGAGYRNVTQVRNLR